MKIIRVFYLKLENLSICPYYPKSALGHGGVFANAVMLSRIGVMAKVTTFTETKFFIMLIPFFDSDRHQPATASISHSRPVGSGLGV